MKEKETKDNNNTFDAYKSKSPVILQRQGFLKHISYPERGFMYVSLIFLYLVILSINQTLKV